MVIEFTFFVSQNVNKILLIISPLKEHQRISYSIKQVRSLDFDREHVEVFFRV